MRTEPAISGEVPYDGILEVLREIEARRITGILRFTERDERGTKQTGEVDLVAGQIALDQEPLPDGSDPVERLLKLRRGHFAVHQRLPHLAVSNGDSRLKTGSLAVHSAADLMNYCEACGLTGTLTFEQDPKRVELVYEAGELLAIRIDGEEGEGDFSHVFDWAMGAFVIEVDAGVRRLVPEAEPLPFEDADSREPTTQFVRPRVDDTGREFLKVVEVALADIDRKRKASRPSHSSPPRTPQPSIRPRPASIPPVKSRRRDPTVPVIYLTPDEPATAVRSDRIPDLARPAATPKEAARFLSAVANSPAPARTRDERDDASRSRTERRANEHEAPADERGAPARARAPKKTEGRGTSGDRAAVQAAPSAAASQRRAGSEAGGRGLHWIVAPLVFIFAMLAVVTAVWIRWPHLAPSSVRGFLAPPIQNSP